MNLAPILPEISLFLGALFILMLDVFLAKKVKNFFYISHLLSVVLCGLVSFLLVNNLGENQTIFSEMFVSNPFTSFAKGLALLLLTFVILLSLNFVFQMQKISAEFLALLLIATTGGMVMISANDFLVFYLGLELQALSLYLLAALNRNSPKSSEAGMKYFILGCLASGILLFGISMIYGFSGTTNFTAINQLYHTGAESAALTANNIPVGVMFGFILVISAMFFKISAAPFHMWSLDVYEGSPTIVTTFFATVAKLTALIAFLRLFYSLLIGWNGIENVFLFVAMLSLAVGSFGAIFQKNLKRLLAYSSVGHVGFILLGMAALARDPSSKETILSCVFYIFVYSIISLGTFGFLNIIISNNTSAEDEASSNKAPTFTISSLSGLAKTHPAMAFAISALMFSTAGIPPLAGFFSKFYILTSVVGYHLLPFAIAAIIFSVISAFYYLRLVKVMYFDEVKNEITLDQMPNSKIIILFTAIVNLVMIFFLNHVLTTISNLL